MLRTDAGRHIFKRHMMLLKKKEFQESPTTARTRGKRSFLSESIAQNCTTILKVDHVVARGTRLSKETNAQDTFRSIAEPPGATSEVIKHLRSHTTIESQSTIG